MISFIIVCIEDFYFPLTAKRISQKYFIQLILQLKYSNCVSAKDVNEHDAKVQYERAQLILYIFLNLGILYLYLSDR
jgi:hypothetical protein